METNIRLGRVFMILPFGLVRTLSGVPVGSNTRHLLSADAIDAPNISNMTAIKTFKVDPPFELRSSSHPAADDSPYHLEHHLLRALLI